MASMWTYQQVYNALRAGQPWGKVNDHIPEGSGSDWAAQYTAQVAQENATAQAATAAATAATNAAAAAAQEATAQAAAHEAAAQAQDNPVGASPSARGQAQSNQAAMDRQRAVLSSRGGQGARSGPASGVGSGMASLFGQEEEEDAQVGFKKRRQLGGFNALLGVF